MASPGLDFERAVARIPRWILGLGALGTPVAFVWYGLAAGTGFMAGAIAGWLNFVLIQRAVNRIARLATNAEEKYAAQSGKGIFIQFAFLLLGVFAILSFSGFSVVAGFCGFLVCPLAVMLEIVYELIFYGHS